MFFPFAWPAGAALHRSFSTSTQNSAKVAELGASAGIGQPLSLLLKNSPLVSRLTLYDIAHTPGVAADLSHIETRAKVKGTGYAHPEDCCLPSRTGSEFCILDDARSSEPQRGSRVHFRSKFYRKLYCFELGSANI
jgi:hypothetical protein